MILKDESWALKFQKLCFYLFIVYNYSSDFSYFSSSEHDIDVNDSDDSSPCNEDISHHSTPTLHQTNASPTIHREALPPQTISIDQLKSNSTSQQANVSESASSSYVTSPAHQVGPICLYC